MDCEKYEPLLLDELYDELDEVTSAAVKRHVQGCARCAAELNGMRSTRRAAALPLVPVPDGLEDRILAAVKEAQKVVPIQSRLSRAISWAGSWAMRPQTAMAAVFLLMIGTSAFVIRSRQGAVAPQAVSVTEQGAPAATVAAAEQDSLDSKAAAAAHGPNVPAPITPPPVAAATATAAASAVTGALALGEGAAGPMDGLTGGKGRAAKEDQTNALASSFGDTESLRKDEASRDGKDKNAEKKTAPRGAMARSGPSDISNAGVPGGAPRAFDGDLAPNSQALAPPAAAKAPAQDPQDGFSAGMAAYRTRNFAEATRHFDAAARSGDLNAALWAGKSVKDGNGGCIAAIPRFDAVAQKAGGAFVGHEAELEAARCQIALGNLDKARERLAKLQSVPSHASQAQQALNELNQVAQRREAERAKTASGAGAGGGSAASRPANAAPARAPAPKPAATSDRAAGF